MLVEKNPHKPDNIFYCVYKQLSQRIFFYSFSFLLFIFFQPKSMEVQIKGDQQNKRFRTVQVNQSYSCH